MTTSTTVRPGAACDAVAHVLRTAGLQSVRVEYTQELGYHVSVPAYRQHPHRAGTYHAVPTSRGELRVRWLPEDHDLIALGTVDRPERVAGLLLDHLHGLS